MLFVNKFKLGDYASLLYFKQHDHLSADLSALYDKVFMYVPQHRYVITR
jgi:hypothetical protein